LSFWPTPPTCGSDACTLGWSELSLMVTVPQTLLFDAGLRKRNRN
jgi:hypothetical protein